MTAPVEEARSFAVSFFVRESAFWPLAESHAFIWQGDLGFRRPVRCFSRESKSMPAFSPMARAAFTKGMSTGMPRSLIRWSSWYSSQSDAGVRKGAKDLRTSISTSTSRTLYFLKSSHSSGNSSDRRRPMGPGREKSPMRRLPSSIFFSESPSALPRSFKERGNPKDEASTCEGTFLPCPPFSRRKGNGTGSVPEDTGTGRSVQRRR